GRRGWSEGRCQGFSGTLSYICYNLALVRLPLATVGATILAALTPVATVSVGAGSGMLVSAGGSVWTTDFTLGQVVRIDPKTNKVARRISLPGRPFGLAYGAGSVWVADREANTMARV